MGRMTMTPRRLRIQLWTGATVLLCAASIASALAGRALPTIQNLCMAGMAAYIATLEERFL